MRSASVEWGVEYTRAGKVMRRGPAVVVIAVLLGAAASHADSRSHPFHAGIYVQAIPPQLRQYFGAPPDLGLLVVGVQAGQAGARAGLQAGDVILMANGCPVRLPSDLLRVIAAARPGRPLRLRVLRNGVERELRIRPQAVAAADPLGPLVLRPTPRARAMDREDLRRQIRRLRIKLDALERRLSQPEVR